MSRICNNMDGKCYILNSSVNLDNDICNACYMPTSCPQSTNSPYQWIFNIPDPYAAQLELLETLYN